MAKAKNPVEVTEPQEPPIQALDNPILCSPYEEPHQHWRYDRETGTASPVDGRRPAGYFHKVARLARQASLFEEDIDELPLVNRLREDVARWRESGYRGASKVTRDLLEHWKQPNRDRRLFFCQIEAVETVIYLAEMRLPGRSARTGFQKFALTDEDIACLLRGDRPDFKEYVEENYWPTFIDKPHEEGLHALIRLGCKMATGSGKTVVMAMLIAWAFCNRALNPSSTQFPNGVLICCPNLTVRDRLAVLKPEHPGNYYAKFNIVPLRYRDALNKGHVEVTNWHAFAPESEHKEGDRTYAVVDKGPETPETFLRTRFPELADRLPLLVLNDEGHHAWRPPKLKVDVSDLTPEERAELKFEQQEATVWVSGLDMINQALGRERGVAFCVDLSATPFYISGSGYPEGRPFPWLVSDFGLVDAIESGITKIPRLPVRDETGRPDPKYYRLWRNVCEKLKAAEKLPGKSGKPKPEVVWRKAEDALQQLAGQWKETFDTFVTNAPGQDRVPPVLIVVCDNTEIAEEFYRRISGETQETQVDATGKETVQTVYQRGAVFSDYLANTETEKRTIRIDSKLLAEAEAPGTGGKKADAAAALRQVVATVGQKGQPGEHVRCVISVSMLTEGWDANNVTHILGLRAFNSQLLCEQVVGRGLRRMSYEPDADGKLTPEYVDVYGIPFSLIPFKGRTSVPPDDRPMTRVRALEERAAFEIRFPVVEGYGYATRSRRIHCDVDRVEPLELEPTDYPRAVFVKPEMGLMPVGVVDSGGPFQMEEQDRRQYYAERHPQEIQFTLAKGIVDRLLAAQQDEQGVARQRLESRHHLFPQVWRIVREYVERRVDYRGSHRCELGLDVYMKRMLERLTQAITWVDEDGRSLLMPILNRYKPIGSTSDVNFITSKPTQPVVKSHVSCVVADTLTWEQSAAFQLDRPSSPVQCFVKNDHLDLVIPYEYEGVPGGYLPDYIVKLANGTNLLLEIKGRETEQMRAKHTGARRWVEAVNNWGKLGKWDFHVNYDPMRLASELIALSS